MSRKTKVKDGELPDQPKISGFFSKASPSKKSKLFTKIGSSGKKPFNGSGIGSSDNPSFNGGSIESSDDKALDNSTGSDEYVEATPVKHKSIKSVPAKQCLRNVPVDTTNGSNTRSKQYPRSFLNSADVSVSKPSKKITVKSKPKVSLNPQLEVVTSEEIVPSASLSFFNPVEFVESLRQNKQGKIKKRSLIENSDDADCSQDENRISHKKPKKNSHVIAGYSNRLKKSLADDKKLASDLDLTDIISHLKNPAEKSAQLKYQDKFNLQSLKSDKLIDNFNQIRKQHLPSNDPHLVSKSCEEGINDKQTLKSADKVLLSSVPRTISAGEETTRSTDSVLGLESEEDKELGLIIADIRRQASDDCQNKAAPVKRKLKDAFGDQSIDKLDDSVLIEDFTQTPSERQAPVNSTSQFSIKDGKTVAAHSFGRHRVIEVTHHRDEVHLKVVSLLTDDILSVVLHGFWTDTLVAVGDIINIIGGFDGDTCHVTDERNLIVVNPDLLVSGTSIVSAVHCMRRSVLNEFFKGLERGNLFMLKGSILHAFFQEICKNRLSDEQHMASLATSMVQQTNFLKEMYALKINESSIVEELNLYIPPILKWCEKYLSSQPSKQKHSDLIITDVVDIEENIWSPRYGIKGKIDLSVNVKMWSKSAKSAAVKKIPLEVKTGKSSHSAEHKGQVTLYSMMFGDRGVEPEGGLLLYLKEPNMEFIPDSHQNRRGLIQLRNELAHFTLTGYLKDEDGNFKKLPDFIDDERLCPKCPQLLNCVAYSRLTDSEDLSSTRVLSGLSTEALSHLLPSHLIYYRHWCEAMRVEQTAAKRAKVEDIWCCLSAQRESAGLAFSNMRLAGVEVSETCEGYFLQSFTADRFQDTERSCLDIGLASGDTVVISSEDLRYTALAFGQITLLSKTSVTLLIERNLSDRKDLANLMFRLDKCETFNTMSINFTNVCKLMENTAHSARLRELVIDLRAPKFDLTFSKSSITQVRDIFKSLNKPQKTAVLKVLMSKDYVLIKGYPGTGKTSTIVALVRILHSLGFSVLLTSFTHSAVDNILLKLKQHDVEFMRLGKINRIHPDIRTFSEDHLLKNVTTVQQLDELYSSKRIVATTCLGVSHVLFQRRRFDFCIVDEASQVLQPTCLGPLYFSDKFVLVGDPLQLSPVVTSDQARELGMDTSLFQRLDSTGGTYSLTLQYRMNSEIMRLCNTLVYENKLACGSKSVEERRLNTDESLLKFYPPWVLRCLSCKAGDEVIFINTSNMNHQEANGKPQNVLEAQLIHFLVKVFLEQRLSPGDIGLITPFQRQVRLLRDKVSALSCDIEVNTVDQYQGRDKRLIIISFVKSGVSFDQNKTCILDDVKRLNVAITRAKEKLIMVGCQHTLVHYPPIKQLLDILNDNQKYTIS